MVEPVTGLVAALGSAKAVLELAKGVNEMGIRSELQGRILELQGHLFELREEMQALADSRRDLEERLSLRGLKFDGAMYWDGDDGPFCPACVDGEGKRARVSKNPANNYMICNVCKNTPVGTHTREAPRGDPMRGRSRQTGY